MKKEVKTYNRGVTQKENEDVKSTTTDYDDYDSSSGAIGLNLP